MKNLRFATSTLYVESDGISTSISKQESIISTNKGLTNNTLSSLYQTTTTVSKTKNLKFLEEAEEEEETILITGAAGFIGTHVIRQILLRSREARPEKKSRRLKIIGYDNLDSVGEDIHVTSQLKHDRLEWLIKEDYGRDDGHSDFAVDDKHDDVNNKKKITNFKFVNGDFCDIEHFNQTLVQNNVTLVVHLDTESYIRTSNSSIPRTFHYPTNDNVDCIVTILDILKQRRQSFITENTHHGNNTDQNVNLKRLPAHDTSDNMHLKDMNQISPEEARTSYYYATYDYVPTINFMFLSSSEPDRYESLQTDSRYSKEIRLQKTSYQDFIKSPRLRSNERIARAYYDLYNISTTALRIPSTTIWGTWELLFPSNPETSSTANPSGNSSRILLLPEAIHIDEIVHDIADLILNDDLEGDDPAHPSKDNSGLDIVMIVPLSSTSPTTAARNSTKSSSSENMKEDNQNFTLVSEDQRRVHEYMQWFKTYNPPQYYVNRSSFAEDSIVEYEDEDNDLAQRALDDRAAVFRKSNDKGFNDEICFVTSMFATDASKADVIYNISHYKMQSNERIKFYFFTNLPEIAENKGWTIVPLNDLTQFRRQITQSRWPKFMAWQHPSLKRCKAVLYADANLPPMDLPDIEKSWEPLISKALDSIQNPSGIYQRYQQNVLRKNRTVVQELEQCVRQHKDLRPNVDAQETWFWEQPDFDNNAFGYWNMIFVYDPNNLNMQRLMTTFWTHYSAEDQSWRDQPLWRYVVSKLNIHPKTCSHSYFNKFWYRKSGANKKNHKYHSEDDNNGGENSEKAVIG